MPKFGKASKARLATIDPELQRLLKEAIKHFDFSVVSGHRGEEEQNRLFLEKKSELLYPNSKHNSFPSKAVDIAPYNGGILWNDERAVFMVAGMIAGIATQMGINVRLGADWDGDLIVNEHSFTDPWHIELA